MVCASELLLWEHEDRLLVQHSRQHRSFALAMYLALIGVVAVRQGTGFSTCVPPRHRGLSFFFFFFSSQASKQTMLTVSRNVAIEVTSYPFRAGDLTHYRETRGLWARTGSDGAEQGRSRKGVRCVVLC